MTNQILYNDDPMLEVDGWRVLCPNMYGKKYKGLTNPVLLHKCSAYIKDPKGSKDWGDMLIPIRPNGNPHCGTCGDPIPEEIQGLLALYYMDSTNIPDYIGAGGS